MFGIGWPEFLVIVVLAIVVIGPKDMPVVLRQLGKWFYKLRKISQDLQNTMDDVVREAEIDDITRAANEPFRDDIKKLEAEMTAQDQKASNKGGK